MLGQHDQETEDFFFLGHINMGDQLNRKMEKGNCQQTGKLVCCVGSSLKDFYALFCLVIAF